MTAEQISILRDTILRVAARFKAPLASSTIEVCVGQAGFRCDAEQLDDHLRYLCITGFLTEAPRSHTAQLRQWQITAAGLRDLEQRGLI